jgi:hypothetical protein
MGPRFRKKDMFIKTKSFKYHKCTFFRLHHQLIDMPIFQFYNLYFSIILTTLFFLIGVSLEGAIKKTHLLVFKNLYMDETLQ